MEDRIFKKTMGPTAGVLLFLWILPDFPLKVTVSLLIVVLGVVLSLFFLWRELGSCLSGSKGKLPVTEAEVKRRMDRY